MKVDNHSSFQSFSSVKRNVSFMQVLLVKLTFENKDCYYIDLKIVCSDFQPNLIRKSKLAGVNSFIEKRIIVFKILCFPFCQSLLLK